MSDYGPYARYILLMWHEAVQAQRPRNLYATVRANSPGRRISEEDAQRSGCDRPYSKRGRRGCERIRPHGLASIDATG